MPTPLATDVVHRRRCEELREKGGQTINSRANGETRPNGLTDWLLFHSLPTPTASDSNGGVRTVRGARAERPGLMSLPDIFEAGMLPTPVAQDWRRR